MSETGAQNRRMLVSRIFMSETAFSFTAMSAIEATMGGDRAIASEPRGDYVEGLRSPAAVPSQISAAETMFRSPLTHLAESRSAPVSNGSCPSELYLVEIYA